MSNHRLFAQASVQAQIKENIKVPRHWALWFRWFPSQRASNAENVSIWWCHHIFLPLCTHSQCWLQCISVPIVHTLCTHSQCWLQCISVPIVHTFSNYNDSYCQSTAEITNSTVNSINGLWWYHIFIQSLEQHFYQQNVHQITPI